MKNMFLLCFVLLLVIKCQYGYGQNTEKKVQPGTIQQSTKSIVYGSYVDSRDNRTYKTVIIGNQTWMAENLAYLPKLTPNSAPFGMAENGYNTPTYYVYQDNDIQTKSEDISIVKQSESFKKYGVLYDYAAARDVCPTGWHVPSDVEWQELEKYLGMTNEDINKIDVFRNSGSVGKKLKSASLWSEAEGIKGLNQFGFNALPAGSRYYKTFYDRGDRADFWGSNVSESQHCVASRRLQYDRDGIMRLCEDWNNAKSVRCLKDR